ncbi:MAG: 3-hydroxyacyl-CoA dehydrogenase family protein [Chloroflexi bacterium]|nr:3-hydroxyacyl-CoA dehydrogenase family protein [Chloroflexota bacterium]
MDVEEIRKVGVVGAGLMGHGIAQEFALAGYDVALHDISEELLIQAQANMRRNLGIMVDAEMVSRQSADSVPDAVRFSVNLSEVVRDADYIVEAITEDLPLKQRVFAEMDKLCPEHTIMASNSSTFMPSSVASATTRPDKVLVTHYFNPPHFVPLVEVVRHSGTSDSTFDTAMSLLERIGKRPVGVRKEVPGFIGNRLQFALLRECLSLVEQGVATPQDIDAVVKNSFGRRLAVAGPFEVFDAAGWDTIFAILTELAPDLDASDTASEVAAENVRQGRLGLKSGAGFYDWTPETAQRLRERIAHALIEIEKWSQ